MDTDAHRMTALDAVVAEADRLTDELNAEPEPIPHVVYPMPR